MSAIVWELEHSLLLPFFWIEIKTDFFQSCGHCWVFQNNWHIECSSFKASSFRIWNSSTGIPSPPLVLFIVMLPKAHLASHSRMSGSRWVIKPSWLSGSWKCVLYSSSVYSWELFLISSASVRSMPFLSFIVPIFAWNVPLVSLVFLKRSLVFPILFSSLSLCTDPRGRLSSLSVLFSGTLHSVGCLSFSLCLSFPSFLSCGKASAEAVSSSPRQSNANRIPPRAQQFQDLPPIICGATRLALTIGSQGSQSRGRVQAT